MEINFDENQEKPNQDTPSAPPKKKIDIKKYEEISADEIPMNKLSLGLWWVKNRLRLKTALIIFLTIVSLLGWGYAFYHFGSYLFFGMRADDLMLRELTETKIINPEDLRAGDLSISKVGVLKTGEKYDMYVRVANPNKKHWGTFGYCFLERGLEIECGNSFIFPEENKYIIILSQKFDRQPNNIKFELGETLWKRINLHRIPDWKKFKKDRLNIDTKEVVFTPASLSGLSEKLNINALSFEAINNSAYNFWEVPLTIILYKGSRIIGVNKYTMEEFFSNEQREVKIAWPGTIGNVSDVEIIPNLNIMDVGVYMNP